MRFACQDRCLRNRVLKTPDDREEMLNYLRGGYMLFFHHIDKPMRLMADLLQRGRAPAEIMRA